MKDRLDRYLRSPDNHIASILRTVSPIDGQQYRTSRTKRIAEIAVAVPLTVASLPLFVGFATAIVIDERRNPFYHQERVGRRHDSPIQVTKISSMRPGSDAPEIFGSAGSIDEHGHPLGIKKDPRVTRIGRLMRPIEADEIPQLWSVIRGNLALVDLRVIPQIDYNRLQLSRQSSEDFPVWEEAYFASRPGLFNLHAAFDDNRKIDNTRRYHWDMFYAKHASLGLDLYIVYRCTRKLLTSFLKGEKIS